MSIARPKKYLAKAKFFSHFPLWRRGPGRRQAAEKRPKVRKPEQREEDGLSYRQEHKQADERGQEAQMQQEELPEGKPKAIAMQEEASTLKSSFFSPAVPVFL